MALEDTDIKDNSDEMEPKDEAQPDDDQDDESVAPPEQPETPLPALPHPDVKRDDDQHKKMLKWIDAVNIADDLDETLLDEIGHKVKLEYDVDVQSRLDWMDKSRKAMDLAMQVAEAKQYPWPRASNVIYPLMTVAAIQFAARAYPAIVSGRNVVKGVVVGSDEGEPVIVQGVPQTDPQGQPMWKTPPGAKRIIAEHIGEHMSWQLLDEQTEWEEETDKLLHIVPIAGCAFRKTFYDSAQKRNVSILVPATKVVINYFAKSVESAPRITEEVDLYPLEIEEMERAGVFREIEYTTEVPVNPQGTPGGQVNSTQDEDAPRQFLEQHRWLDLDDDDYPEPYVVTVHSSTSKVVRITARYDHHGPKFRASDGKVIKIDPIHYYTKYDFLPNPDGGIYGIGFGQLLRPINEATNTSLNMMIDAAHLQVVGGGFIGKGLSMHTGTVRFTPGEYKSVNAIGSTIKDNIVPLDHQGPSLVMFQLLQMLIEAGKEISAVKDVLTGEQKESNIPATTTLALIEQGLKTFTAIYKRIHRALKKELDKLYRLNSIYLPEAGAGFRVNNQWKSISRRDYMAGNGVEPVSDPSMVSDMQKMGRAQFLMTFANDPMCNGLEIRRRVMDAASIPRVEDIVLKALPPNPEIIAKAAELEVKQERTKAEAIRDYAQAILYLAQADKVIGDAHLAWVEQQVEILKARMEQLNGEGTGGPGNGAGNNGAGPGGLAAPPGNQGGPPIPAGLPFGSPGPSLGVPPGGSPGPGPGGNLPG